MDTKQVSAASGENLLGPAGCPLFRGMQRLQGSGCSCRTRHPQSHFSPSPHILLYVLFLPSLIFFILKYGKLLFILLVLIMDYPCCIIKAVYASSHLILSVMTTVKRVVTSHTNEEMSSRKFPKILAHPRTHSWYMVGLGCEPRFDEWRYIQPFYLHNLNIFRLMCFL